MDENLHSPQRRLIELRMEHADLDRPDRPQHRWTTPADDLTLRRLKKRRLLLRDQIARSKPSSTRPSRPDAACPACALPDGE
jgi:hypothetical protein